MSILKKSKNKTKTKSLVIVGSDWKTVAKRGGGGIPFLLLLINKKPMMTPDFDSLLQITE